MDDLADVTPEQAQAALWQEGILSWLLHANQLIIDDSIESLPPATKEAAIVCARRWGKSFYGCVRATAKGIQAAKPRLTRIIGPDIKQTKMIVEYNMAKLKLMAEAVGMGGIIEHVKSENMYRVGNSAIFLGGFDSQEDSLRGGEADEILLEESGMSDPDQYNYQMRSVLKPQLLKTRGKLIHLTTLPPLPDHPFITETIPATQLDDSYYSFDIYADPLATPEMIADAIKDCGGIHTPIFRREFLNLVTRDSSLIIIPDFDKTLDVEAFDVPRSIKLEVFTDWGGVRDFTVSLLIGYDFLRGCDLVVDELWHKHNTPTDVIVKEIREKWGVEEPTEYFKKLAGFVGKPQRHLADVPGQLQIDLATQHKYPVVLPFKADWEAGINNMANRFTQRKVKIHPRCKLTVQTCQSGVLNKNRTDFDRSASLGHMDAVAALMYGIRSLDRTNPYSDQSRDKDWQWVRPLPQQADVVPTLKLGQPKGIRKFGQ